MSFNPFGEMKAHEIGPAELAKLASIREGWFIEYKREPCQPTDYAKEASAFANAHGGWLFIGLDEDRETKTPKGGPGLPREEVSRLLDSARDCIVQNLSPSPYVELSYVLGPIPELSIKEDKCVLVIHIPESQNTPHVHLSGRIYLRQADTCEPVVLNDRAELDRLYERRSLLKDLIHENLNIGFDEQWAKDMGTPWIHIALIPDPTESTDMVPLSYDRFRETIEASSQDPRPLPDIYSSNLGYVARNHRYQDTPSGAATALEYGLNGAFFLTLPLSCGSLNRDDIPHILQSTIGRMFLSLLVHHSFENCQVIDGSCIIGALITFEILIKSILKEVNAPKLYHARIRFWNFFRCVPFIDSASYVEWCRDHTIPVIPRGTFSVPWTTKDWIDVEDIHDEHFMTQFIVDILASLGVDVPLLNQIFGTSRNSVFTAFHRMITAQGFLGREQRW